MEKLMELTLSLIQQIIKLFLMVFMGYAVVKLRVMKSSDSMVLSKAVLYIIIPCVMISAFQTEFSPEKMHGLLLAIGAGILTQALLLVLTVVIRKPLRMSLVEWTSVYYSNSGNFIIPLVTSLLGPEWVLYASGFLAVQTIMQWTHLKNAFSHENLISWKAIFGNLNLISIFAGLILFFLQIRLPAVANETLKSVGDMIGPLSMIVTGMLMGNIDLKAVFTNKRLYFIAFMRLVAYPAAALVILFASRLAYLLPDGKMILLVTFLALLTPAASTVTQMAQVYGEDSEYAGAIGVITTLLCIFTMPVFVFLYQAVI